MHSRTTNGLPHLLRLLHWILSVGFVILFLTGLSLHLAARPDWSVSSGVLPSWLWTGRVYVWHFWAAVAFFPAILTGLFFCWKRRRLIRPLHCILILSGGVAVITGLWLMFPFGSFIAIKVVVAVHAVFGLVVLPAAFLWHLVEGLTRYLRVLVASFRPLKDPEWKQSLAFLGLAVVTTWILFEGWPLRPPWRSLHAVRIEPTGGVDDLTRLPWERAVPLRVRLVNGSGFYSGQTDLSLWALHDGVELYVKAVWRDPSADREYWPWKRTCGGWEHLQTSTQDETVHYEDKFSLLFPIEASWHFEQVGCAVHCHLDGSYGWGYKGAVPDVDVWHWKSVRTDPVGQVDDKYWSELDFDAKDVGRHGDPSPGGGYVKNVSEDGTRPDYLPRGVSSVHNGSILAEDAAPYSTEAASRVEPEALVPGIVCAPFAGDRGQVTCASMHREDRWILHIRRALDTGSEHDVRFQPGRAYPFGSAAFDSAAKRHAYSMPVLWLVFEE